jgi:peptidoglycan/xylan/chitin deacetylase (PgdA/CDA1 family)
MTTDPGRRSPTDRSGVREAFESPWLTAAVGMIAVAMVGVVLVVSGLIVIPTGISAASPTTTVTATPAPTLEVSVAPTFGIPTPSPEPTFRSYTVRAGDTLTSIARAFQTTARSIAWWNRGTYPSLDPESPKYNPNRIALGWVLVLIPGTVVDENNPPSPSPAPASSPPGPSPSPTAAASTAAASIAAATVISHGLRGTPQVALTFDMGGRLDPAVAIVQWLVDHRVHATLFPTGSTGSTTTQGVAALKLARAHPELFDIGNHSWNHPDFTTLTPAQMASQLTRCEAAIAPIAGQTTRPWFRPPYGAWNAAVRSAVGQAGWRYLVMWDVDTLDWKATADGGPTTADIVSKITAKAQGGSIALMHLGGWHTLEALPGILAAVTAKGLQPVTLGAMFGQ